MLNLLSNKLFLRAELGLGELSEKADCVLLQVGGQTGPDVWNSAGQNDRRWLTTHGVPSRTQCVKDIGGILAPEPKKKERRRLSQVTANVLADERQR
jgi:hypothetical protein